MSSSSSSSVTISEEPMFDPNAFGMATLLGGLFILGIASDMMIDSATDTLAWSLGYFGLTLIICSFISFTYSFIYCVRVSTNELRPLVVNRTEQHQHRHFHHQYYGSSIIDDGTKTADSNIKNQKSDHHIIMA
ncbi:hypothetical protein DERF_000730 [Dermatophagoides farinae]|uniref:Uncharacterized protein n=1 Tax=Dermatophagoides farinae TaxID=6954 RepID=A0A922IC67_DERFA|nr:hypothetical protein DERF_000730 [Dermatophagoides farinae]